MIKRRKRLTKKGRVVAKKRSILGSKAAWQRFWDHYCQM